MTVLRSLSTVFDRLSAHMQGQDVERHNVVHGRRANADVAALMNGHAGRQGVTPLGFGR